MFTQGEIALYNSCLNFDFFFVKTSTFLSGDIFNIIVIFFITTGHGLPVNISHDGACVIENNVIYWTLYIVN